MDLIKRVNNSRGLSEYSARRALTRKNVLVILKILLTAAFIFFANRKLEWEHFSLIWTQARLIPIAAALVLGFTAVLLHIVRWKLILMYEGFTVSNQIAAKTYLFGLLLAFITPGRLGELFRGLEISEKNKTSTLFAVIVDNLFTICAVFLFAFCCVIIQKLLFGRLPHAQFAILTSVAAVISVVVLILAARGSILKKKPLLRKFGMRIIRLSPRIFSPVGRKVSYCTIGAHLALVAQTVIVFQMFGNVEALKGALAAGQAYAFMTLMPFFMANMGIREYSYSLFLGQLHTHGEAAFTSMAFNSSVMILMLNLILPALIGLVWSLVPVGGGKR